MISTLVTDSTFVCVIIPVVPDVARYIDRKIGIEDLMAKGLGTTGDGGGKGTATKNKTTKATAVGASGSGAAGGGAASGGATITTPAAVVGTTVAGGLGTTITAAVGVTTTGTTGASVVGSTGAGGVGSAATGSTLTTPLAKHAAGSAAAGAVVDSDISEHGDVNGNVGEYGSEVHAYQDHFDEEQREESRKRKAMLNSRLESAALANRVFGSHMSQNLPESEVTRILGLLRQSRLYCEQGMLPYTQDSNGRTKKNSLFVKIYHECSDLVLKYIGDEDDDEYFLKSSDYEPSRLVSH